ncbi:YbfB/YjiJ family MFS transporter [Amycolatopsis nigrescens]|uniref:YbfB/YjiJ family MFS transporter n=1 Tax=Amycolatopsis nigrescens TaxID=381445 RepID=UPI000365D5F6|nr:YbfB/YjiJ family MFS transporter [Amycolatopsis nigrescens]
MTESSATAATDTGAVPFGTTLRIVAGLALGPAVALGLARFAYALLLPPMRTALDWSYSTAGAMNTANAVGYLAGALLATTAGRRWGTRRTFIGGIAVTGVLLLASAATGQVVLLMAFRLLVGASGAASFITGGALAAQLGQGQRPARVAALFGVYFGGGGLGITVSGLALPPVLASAGLDSGWRWGWVLLGALTLLSLCAAVPAARRSPVPATNGERRPWPASSLAFLLCGYTIFGAGYIAYMTFIVAFLQADGADATTVSLFWAALGLAAIAGGFVWGPMLGRLRGGRGPAVLMLLVTVGAALPLASGSAVAMFGSAVVFGISFLAVVAAVTTVARTALRPQHWAAAIAALTTGFALGQGIGPILAGLLADGADGVRAGLTLSTVILLAGAVVCLAQPARRAPVESL